MHVDWVGWSVRVVLGLLWFEGLLRLMNNGQRTAAASLLVFGLMSAAVETWVRPLRWWRQRRAEPWPVIQAHVESWNVSPVGGGEDGYYKRKVAYPYSVGDEFWSGFFARDFDTESEAWAFVGALKGKTVLVNYHPDKHDVSALTDSALHAAIPDPSVLRERHWLRFPLRPGD